ncbi:SDR family NAD(P)-dependent oxidoreductase [Microbacterium sp. CPCC 204701]|uniref:SDR family NAD(P)-dependent oxidoreductase n=1 Tax=Microbacterium sp. CPCC 204701 TaxID=2493084 RepID=UPI00197C476D|nr:SDR family NAD(P)-dependent oxidoreductase [Microbacterium sp. CPCC 204701]
MRTNGTRARRVAARRPGSVVVIAGASSGIGRATARRYASEGARLVLASRSSTALEEVVAECRAAGAEAIAVPTDVRDEAAVRALAERAVREFGRIDVWVTAAGVFAYGGFEDLPPDIFRQVVETNLMGQVHAARAALPQFRRQRSGTLVMVGSLYSRVGSPLVSPYVTSKFGLLGFAIVLRQELRRERGIRIRIVLPSTIDTPIYQNAANVTGRRVHPLPPVSSPERVARAIAAAPHRRRFATHVGQSQRAAILVQRFAPGIHDWLTGTLKRTVELRGSGEPATDGTVFAPPAHAGGTTGRWRSWPVRAGGAIAGAVLAVLAVLGARAAQRKPSA